MFALPLHAGGVRHSGAVDLYRRTPGDLSDADQTTAAEITAAATELLTLERLGLDWTGAFTDARLAPSGAGTPIALTTRRTGATAAVPSLVRWFDQASMARVRIRVHTVSTRHGLTRADADRFALAVHETMATRPQRARRTGTALAFAALGAAELLRADPGDEPAASLLSAAATVIGHPGSDPCWPWPEDQLTYANAALDEALIAAGDLLDYPPVLADGLRMLTWLLDVQTDDGHLSVLPAAGWRRGATRARYDQQPIEVAALADACATAAAVTGAQTWSTGVHRCIAWFLGDNDIGRPMWDAATEGGYDGLTPIGPNLDQGAESTLALIATLQHRTSLSPFADRVTGY